MDSTIGEAPLWMRILRVPGWRWASGMSAVHMSWSMVLVREVDLAAGVAVCHCAALAPRSDLSKVVLSLKQLRPDLDDRATLDHLLALLREACGDPTITTQYHPSEGAPERKRWRVWRDGCPIAYGATEAEALVAALEAALPPKP